MQAIGWLHYKLFSPKENSFFSLHELLTQRNLTLRKAYNVITSWGRVTAVTL